jgi:hypothetical protein
MLIPTPSRPFRYRNQMRYLVAVKPLLLGLLLLFHALFAAGKSDLKICPESGSDASKKLRDELKGLYGIHPCMWSGYVDQESEKERFDWFLGSEVSTNLNAAYTYTIATGEGLALYFIDPVNKKKWLIETAQNTNYWIDGFELLGLDNFITDLPRMRNLKLLPDSFVEGNQFIRDSSHTNEMTNHVISADFKTFPDAIVALTADLKLRNLKLKDDAKTNGFTLAADQEAFWTYAYFCMGEGRGKRILTQSHGNLHEFKATAGNRVPDAIRQRVGAWRIVEAYSLFKK